MHADIFINQKLLIDKHFNGKVYKPNNELKDCNYVYRIYYGSLLLDFENQIAKLVNYIETFGNQHARIKSNKSILGNTRLANPNNIELILQKPVEHVEQWKKLLKGEDIQKDNPLNPAF